MTSDTGIPSKEPSDEKQHGSTKLDENRSSLVSNSWAEWKNHLHAYMTWVNSQLRKKPGCQTVTSLRNDLQDGIILSDLIEVLANEQVVGINRQVVSPQAKRENIERILQFMASKRMKISNIHSKDITEGHLKPIMKVILTLAAHYKPSCISQSPSPVPRKERSITDDTLTTLQVEMDRLRRRINSSVEIANMSESWRNKDLDSLSFCSLMSDAGRHIDGASRCSTPFSITSNHRRMKKSKSVSENLHSRPIWKELEETQQRLLSLQQLLLSGHATETNLSVEYRSQGTSTVDGSPAEEKVGLISDASLDDIKQELMKTSITNQSLELEKEELNRSIEEKEQVINELRKEVNSRDHLIQQQKLQFDEAVRNLTSVNKAKATLTAKLAEQDRKLLSAENSHLHKPQIREELQVVREAIHSLRKSFRGNDPQHHTIDTIEQSIALLMERLHLAETQKEGKYLNFDSTGDPRRSPITTFSGYQLSRLDSLSNGADFTKVVYFTERSVTPFMSSIPKRLGEITLRDFKIMCERPGNYRYHFKSMDPEYGMVKEEILHDEDILPGWDGKIIAWVEEDHG